MILISLGLPFADKTEQMENRSLIWQTALTAGLNSPILGHGFGNIQSPLYQTAKKLNNPTQYLVVDSSHNFILDFWVQGGIVAVITLATLILLSFQGLIKHRRHLEITALLGILAALLFNPLSVVNLLAFWWLIGQGFE
jgi:O-antigen ligase